MKKLEKQLGDKTFDIVLDIATRDGAFIKKLIKSMKSYNKVIGIDISDEGFSKMSEEFCHDNRIDFKVMDGCRTDFPDNYFDMVCISNSLHHIEDISMLLKEMIRIKKKDGLILINELPSDGQDGPYLTHALVHKLDCLIDTYSGKYHRLTYTHEEIMNFVKNENIEIVEAFDDVESNSTKNEAIAKRANGASAKINKFENTSHYEELNKVVLDIEKNYQVHGANTAFQYIVIGK